MSDEGRLELSIETAPLERAAKSLDDLASAAKRTETAVDSMESGAATAGAAMGTLGSKAAGTNRSLSSAADELRNVTRAATDLSSAAGRVRGFDSIASMSADLKSLLASVQQVNQALLATVAAQSSASRAAEDLQRRIREEDAALREQARSAREAARAAAEKAAADARAASAGDAFIASLKRQAETMGFNREQLLRYQAAQLGVSAAAAPFIARLNEADKVLGKTGVSAAQTAAAMRMLPAQFTDVATQLAGGQNPLLILLQQGGQVKDSFGGLGPMFRGLGAAITPTIALIGAAAAGAATLGVAFVKGRDEGSEFTKQIILTGNAAGLSADQFADAAASISKLTGNQGAAAAALAQLAATGKIAGGSMEKIGRAAELMRTATGKAVSDTVAEFVRLADEPAKASAKLNESMHYLTASTYERIAALEKQGNKEEAAALAQATYADAMDSRAQAVKKSLGTLESAWDSVGKAAAIAWNKMLDIGRPETDLERLNRMQGLLGAREATGGPRRGTLRTQGDFDLGNAALREEIALLQSAQREKARFNALDAQKAAIEQASIDAQQKVGALLEQHASKQSKMNRELGDARRHFESIRAADPFSPLLAKERQVVDGIRKTYADTSAVNDGIDARIEALKRGASLSEAVVRAQVARENTLYRLGAQNEISFIEKVAKAELGSLRDSRAALVAEAALHAKKVNSLKAVAEAKGQIGLMDQRIAAREQQFADDTLFAQERVRLAYVQRVNDANEAAAAVDRQLTVAKQEATTIGMTAGQLAKLTAARSDEAAAAIRVAALWANGGDALDAAGEAALRLADRLQKLGRQEASNLALKDLAEYLDPDRAFDFGDKLASSLGRAGDAMQDLLGAFSDYAKLAAKFDRDRETASYIIDDTKRAKALAQIEADSQKASIQGYAQMAGAAKGFFNEKSRGYQVMHALEAGFTAFQLAQNLIQGASLAAVAVAKQAAGGDAYSAWARMAAMAAAMAALGFAVTGGLGSGRGGMSAADRQAQQGRGTVLGDATAQSESLANALERLQDSAKLELTYQSEMVRSLRSIDAAMNGLGQLIVRTTGLTSGNAFGVQTGVIRKGSQFLPSEIDFTNPQNSLLKYLGPSLLDKALGGTVAKFAENSLLFKAISGIGKVSQDILDTGLIISGTVADLMAGRGVGQYADVQTTKSYLWGAYKDRSTSTVVGSVDEQISRQFGLVFAGIADALQASAGALGRDADAVGAQIESYFVDLPKASLRGLSGAALQEAVTALLSTAADDIASKFVPGLEAFQQVGEGLFETVVRVASGVEEANYALERFGLRAIDYSAIVEKQGDVAAEILRQSIARAETYFAAPAGGIEGKVNKNGTADRTGINDTVEMLTGVGRIIESLSGSASDIAEVYQALLDVRAVMKSVGETGLDLSQAMLRGAGGLDALKSGLDAYLEGFFTTAEQTAAATARLGDQFVRIGVQMPTSNAEFRKLVEGIDTTSESGQLLYGQVIALAGAFAELNPLAQEAANAVDLLAAKRLQELRIMELQGDAAGALAGRRADELASLRKEGYDEEYLANQRLIFSLEDAAEAASKAAAAEADRARAAEAVAQQAATFQRQILELRGDTAGLRALDLQAALSDENRAMLSLIHTLTDAKAAADLAAQAEATRQQAIDAQTKSLLDQIFALENAGNTAALRAKEFADLADPSLEPLLRRLHALQDEATAADAARRAQEEQARVAEQLAEAARQAAEALANQRTSILDDIFNLENAGNVAALRERELLALDASLRPLKERYFALLDIAAAEDAASRAADERASIEGDILSLLGDTAAIRARELAALDPSNRDLKAMFYALQDQQAAAEIAQRAAEEAAQAAQQLAEAWGGVADTLLEEVDRIRGSMAADVLQSYAQLQGQFAIGTAAARAGDMTAAQSLPALAQSMLEAARNSASSAAEFRFAQASTAASLEKTAAIARQIGDSAAPAAVVGTQALPSYTIQQPQTVFVTSDPAAQQEIAALKQQIADQDKRFALMESALVAIATSTSRIARSVDSVTGENGDSIAVSTREGDALEVTP